MKTGGAVFHPTGGSRLPTVRPGISIFTAKLDRAAFTAYFLGAIVPLVTLAVVLHRFVLPDLEGAYATEGMLALLVSLTVLSLSSFLALRRTTRRSLAEMKVNNARLASLLSMSRTLSTTQYENDAAQTTTRCALELTSSGAAFMLLAGDRDAKPALSESAGNESDSLFETEGAAIAKLADVVMTEGTPIIRGPGEGGDGLPATVIMPIPGETRPAGAIAVVHADDRARFEPSQIDALASLASLASVALQNADLRDSQRNFFAHTTELLSTAVDGYEAHRKEHGRRVARFANRLGRALELDDKRLERLHFAALLHDIGMLKVDRALHHSAKVAEKHTIHGHRLLARIRLWEDIAPIVLYHHEKYDGSGYPEGLSGEDIPYEARIIAVCDAFETMTGKSSYKVPMTVEEAARELLDCSGSQFDPTVARAFVRLIEDGQIDIDD
jgi:HD-GYP domain-containing protein (c-di-GMP phosphodiesterase class II)